MNKNEDSNQPTRPGGSSKKPYQKPAFRHERVFETQALTCGKITGTGGPCSLNKKAS